MTVKGKWARAGVPCPAVPLAPVPGDISNPTNAVSKWHSRSERVHAKRSEVVWKCFACPEVDSGVDENGFEPAGAAGVGILRS